MGQTPLNPCIGRDREIAQLSLIIGPGTDGLRLGMLRGPSGVGKTTISRVAAEQAQGIGFDVAVADGRAGSLSTPLAPWFEALPELRSVLSDQASVDIDRAAAALMTVLTDRTHSAPLLIIFDDAQSLDESSIALLGFATGVSESMNLSMFLVEQSDAIDVSASYRNFIDVLLAKRLVQRLDLETMDDAAISGIVRSVLGVGDDVAIPMELVIRAEGNPWFAKALAESYVLGDDEIPVTIAAAATSRLYRLDETAQDLVNAVAICPEGAPLGWLDELSEQKPLEFARTMNRIKNSGLIRERDNVVAIAHPLMQQAFMDEMSAAMRRALHVELARVAAMVDLGEVVGARGQAYHLGQAGQLSEAVEQYVRAARASEASGQLHEAFADYYRALEVEPRIEKRVELLQLCGMASLQISSPAGPEIWSELARLSLARNDDATYAYALVQQYSASNDGLAVERLERAASIGSDAFGWSARAAALLCTLEGDYPRAIEHDSIALQRARECDDRFLESSCLINLGTAYASVGDLEAAIDNFEAAVVAAQSQGLHERVIFGRIGLAETLAENLDTQHALEESAAVVAYVDDLRLERYRPFALAFHAHCLIRVGDLDSAATYSENAIVAENRFQPEHFSALVWTIRAEIAVEMGEMGIGEPIIRQAVAAATDNGWESWVFEARFFEARFLVQQGNLDAALEILRALAIDEPAAMARLALWASRIGLLLNNDELLDIGRSLRGDMHTRIPFLKMIGQEIDASLAAKASSETEQLIDISERWTACDRPLDAARVLLSAGVIARGAEDERANAMLVAAREALTVAGAKWETDLVAGILRGMGARTRSKTRATAVGNLTSRELEISRLVATGLRNADVAQQLFLAEKTVAAHLSNVYGKLGVRSRVELAQWITDNDSSAVGA